MEDWPGPERRCPSVKFAIGRGEPARNREVRLRKSFGPDSDARGPHGDFIGVYAERPVWTGVHLKDAPPLGEIHLRNIVSV
jgi:hypothetical protein